MHASLYGHSKAHFNSFQSFVYSKDMLWHGLKFCFDDTSDGILLCVSDCVYVMHARAFQKKKTLYIYMGSRISQSFDYMARRRDR